MDEQQGLAAQSTNMAPRADGSGQGNQQQIIEMVKEVMKLLMNGTATPESLLQQGVPREVIEMAIAELQKMQATEQAQVAEQAPATPQGQGLAAQGV